MDYADFELYMDCLGSNYTEAYCRKTVRSRQY
jgi:hypothetical protein